MLLRDVCVSMLGSPEAVTSRIAWVRRRSMVRSPRLAKGNFTRLAVDDLWLLLALYDRSFFQGKLGAAVGGPDGGLLRFRLSTRMTQAAGKTFYDIRPTPRKPIWEIAISTHLLLSNFRGTARDIRINGSICRDRLDALQRIFEHELVHLLELLTQGKTSCRTESFRRLAHGLFGHTEVTHGLVTGREWARLAFGVRVGDRVHFEAGGRSFDGIVNRVTKRATVLVEDGNGRLYSDGKRYRRFYLPLEGLSPAA